MAAPSYFSISALCFLSFFLIVPIYRVQCANQVVLDACTATAVVFRDVNYTVCVRYLESENKTKDAADRSALAQITLDLLQNDLKVTVQRVLILLKQKWEVPLKGGLSDCRTLYTQLSSQIVEALAEFKAKKYFVVQTILTKVHTGVGSCEAELEATKGKLSTPPLTKENSDLKLLSAIASALFFGLAVVI